MAGKRAGSTTVTHPNGSQTVYHFNERLLLTAIENWNQSNLVNQKLFFYDAKQHLSRLEIKDGRGNILIAKHFECDAAGNPLLERWESDCGVFTIQRAFSKNRLIREERGDGSGIAYEYLGNTRLVTSEQTLDHGTLIRKKIFRYDEANNLVEEREEGRTHTTYLLYPKGPHLHRPEWIIQKDWDGQLLRKTHLVYDSWGHLSEEGHYGSDDQLAYTIRRTYNQRGDLLTESNPLGYIAKYECDPRGRCVEEVPFAQEPKMQRTFDAKGRVTLLQEGERTTQFAYNTSDEVVQTKDYLGFVTRYTYDPIHGKPTSIEDPLSFYAIRYNPFGWESEREDAYGAKILTTYNSFGAPVQHVYADGAREEFSYDAGGRCIRSVDADGLVTLYDLDSQGRCISKARGTAKTMYRYDAYNLIEEIDAEGISTQYVHDALSRKTQETRAGRATRYGYDSLGFLARTETGSRWMEQKNDLLGRPLEKSYDGQIISSWSYDPAGNIATHTTSGTTRYVHDPYRRLLTETDPLGNQTTFSYEAKGQQLLKRIKDARGVVILETYNGRNLLVHREMSGSLLEEIEYDRALRKVRHDQFTFTYTATGLCASCTEAGLRTTSYTYTPGGKIQTKKNPDESVLTYTYNQDGFLAQVGNRQFQYDKLGRLIVGTGFKRTLDPFGNLLPDGHHPQPDPLGAGSQAVLRHGGAASDLHQANDEVYIFAGRVRQGGERREGLVAAVDRVQVQVGR